MATNYEKKILKKLEEIETLSATPNQMRDLVLDNLNKINLDGLPYAEKTMLNNVISALKNISDVSIQKSYNIIYNQMCILAITALGVILEEYFCNFIQANVHTIKYGSDLKIGIKELACDYEFQTKKYLGQIIIEKDSSINFQDLGSTLNTWKKYLERDIILDTTVEKNLIFFQQCRHVIVHKDGIIDENFIERTQKRDANIKNYQNKEKVQLNNEDWLLIKSTLENFIKILIPSH